MPSVIALLERREARAREDLDAWLERLRDEQEHVTSRQEQSAGLGTDAERLIRDREGSVLRLRLIRDRSRMSRSSRTAVGLRLVVQLRLVRVIDCGKDWVGSAIGPTIVIWR
ncbi:hypothetical protein [Streptacidiphilus sp. MAP5-3]|uniref:hypothetical protein n=1 Tax=unclassified Streptacidiphilus TaxID=2643834 RepID=UPI0035149912